jgi:Xaa-Pro dipeptidase
MLYLNIHASSKGKILLLNSYISAPLQAYMPIVAFGRNGAVLHYGKNDAKFSENRNDLVLVDAGCEYKLYASDVTRAFPVGGKFVGDYKTLYDIVLASQLEVIAMIKAGVYYEELHRHSLEVVCRGLVNVLDSCFLIIYRLES